MTTGGTLTLLVAMTAVSWGQSSLIDRAAPRYQAVTSVIVHALTAGFVTMTAWCVAGGFAITAFALLTGRAAGGDGRHPDPFGIKSFITNGDGYRPRAGLSRIRRRPHGPGEPGGAAKPRP